MWSAFSPAQMPSSASFTSIVHELDAWTSFLGIRASEEDAPSFTRDILSILTPMTPEALTIIDGYVKQLPHVIRLANAKIPADSKKKPKDENIWSVSIRSLAVSPPYAFMLPKLPQEFNTLMQQHFQMRCSNCENSTEPAICLVTGELLCAACQKSGVKEKGAIVGSCTLHSRRIGAGFGMISGGSFPKKKKKKKKTKTKTKKKKKKKDRIHFDQAQFVGIY
jgi:hypothetical protein